MSTLTASRLIVSRYGGFFDKSITLLVLFCGWQALAEIAGVHVLPGPLATVKNLIVLMVQSDFGSHISETGSAFLAALAISFAGGLILGVVLGAHRLAGEVTEPLLVGLYSIPKITLYPVVLLLFGLGMSAKVAFGSLHGIVPVILFTLNAVRNIPPIYIRTAKAMRLSPIQMFIHVLVPASLPEIITGFRLGFALTLLGTLIGEMFASQKGIGYLLIYAMETSSTDMIVALAFLLVFFATGANWLILALEQRLHGRAPHL